MVRGLSNCRGMDDVISLSSDSDEDDSDVEIIGHYSNLLTKTEPLPFSAVRVHVRTEYSDLTDPQWIPPQLKINLNPDSTSISLVNLTEITLDAEHETEKFPQDDSLIENVNNHTPDKPDTDYQNSPSVEPPVSVQERNCEVKPMQSCTDQTQFQNWIDEACLHTPSVKLARLPVVEAHITELKASCSLLTKDCMQISLQSRQLESSSEKSESLIRMDRQQVCQDLETPANFVSSNKGSSTSTHDYESGERMCEWQDSPTPWSLSETKGMDYLSSSWTSEEAFEFEDPVCFFWQDDAIAEQENKQSGFDMDFHQATREDRDFVCPVALEKLMSGQTQALLMDISPDEGFGTPQELCHWSLRLVYSTIEEKYTEGTLQLLSDLLQPGYYLPRDIIFHLLHGVLLNSECPHHQCLQAFQLLIRAQRHHLADINTVPWDWELLTSVVTRRVSLKCEVVCMFLEYVLRTLEDDFYAKLSISALHHSIVRDMLSCDRHFPHIREALKWLLTAIRKSTEYGKSNETKKRDEQIRMVSSLQKMLSLALEADRCPTLQSNKLSQEIFHMLIDSSVLREHRMLLLEGLENKLLKCKVVEHLLDYACPVKASLPMSLSLLLHFMHNCMLEADPMDGTERWQKWEELVDLLWMFMVSYNKAMKGYLCHSFVEDRSQRGTFKQEDMISKPDVCESVEAFLSRSQADIGQAIPVHVEESLSSLQDYLLDLCQC